MPEIGEKADSMLPEIRTPLESGESMALLGRIMELEDALRRQEEAQRISRGDAIGIDNTKRMMADIATMEMRLRSVEGSIQDAASATIPIEGVYRYEEDPEIDSEIDPSLIPAKAVAKMSKETTGTTEAAIEFDTVVRESNAASLNANVAQGGILVKKAGDYLVGCSATMTLSIDYLDSLTQCSHTLILLKAGVMQETAYDSFIDEDGRPIGGAREAGSPTTDDRSVRFCITTTLVCAVGELLTIMGMSDAPGGITQTSVIWAVEI